MSQQQNSEIFFGRRNSVFSRSTSLEMNGPSEIRAVCKNQFLNRSLAVLTSGGDSPGMNSAVRAIVRMGIYLGCRVYLIHEGFKGLVEGGHTYIELATWNIVSGIVGLGGTIIGSTRCEEFLQRTGRLKAAKNLIKTGINNLVCIGGDGTLTGANVFKKEWPSLLEELVQTDQITFLEQIQNKVLNIVGIVGSIDNDFAGTDMTIGTDSALHRIIEAIDAINTTALSHQRCFVLEVMGRNCGYLALSAGLASEADWIFIPENPPEKGWEDALCKGLVYHREAGHRLNIVIVAEGAIDKEGNRISSDYVKNIICERLKIDTRLTILGHVQRGGTPSAYDRILGARMGCEAVLALMMHPLNSKPIVISINGNQTNYIPLEESVERTRAVAKSIKDKDFVHTIELRGASFKRNLETYLKMSKLESPVSFKPLLSSAAKVLAVSDQPEASQETKVTNGPINKTRQSLKFAVLNLGAPSCGVNSVIRSFVRHGVAHGCTILAINDGFEGLIADRVKELKWKCVYGWTGIGGSLLGCQRVDAKQVGFQAIANKLKEYRIDGMLVIGGFEAFTSVLQLSEMRDEFKEFRIPLICVPATISNNVPGSDFSIGCDTALNEIVLICDKLKQSAIGSTRRVFLVETMGGYCGYLASSAGLAAGADQSYIFEEKFTINDLIEDIRHFKVKMEGDLKRGLLIRNEMANKNYTSQFIQSLMSEEGKGVFSARMNIIGHMQQGGVPTPFDRNLGIKFGAKSLKQMLEIIENEEFDHNSALVIGIRRNLILFTPVKDLVDETDFEHRLPKKQWWLNLRPLNRILGKHEAMYTSEILSDNDLKIEDKDEKDIDDDPSIF